jgi:preprotein translocase subunit SecE
MGKKRGSATKGGAKKGQQKKEGFLASPRRFAREVQGELKRVNWPDRDQLRQSTAVVLGPVVPEPGAFDLFVVTGSVSF